MEAIYVLWPDAHYSLLERKENILRICKDEKNLRLVDKLIATIDDEYSTVKSPAPKLYRGNSMVATIAVSTELESTLDHFHVQFEKAGFVVGQYIVEQSIYKDYGDNEHANPRDWPDGQKTPTVVLAVSLLTRPAKYSLEEWIRRWHGKMSPGSEAIQPRARYVRNIVLSVKRDSPKFDGIVVESWPSAQHISDPYKFYLSNNPIQLVWRIIKMLRLVTQFHQLHKIQVVTMSEYFIKTDHRCPVKELAVG